jgi:hypothetical protein
MVEWFEDESFWECIFLRVPERIEAAGGVMTGCRDHRF